MTREEYSVVAFSIKMLKIINKEIPTPHWFRRKQGLCNNYFRSHFYDSFGLSRIVGWETNHPFGDYYRNGEFENDTIYQNEQRLAFLREWASKE